MDSDIGCIGIVVIFSIVVFFCVSSCMDTSKRNSIECLKAGGIWTTVDGGFCKAKP